jgi:hypothetical protein
MEDNSVPIKKPSRVDFDLEVQPLSATLDVKENESWHKALSPTRTCISAFGVSKSPTIILSDTAWKALTEKRIHFYVKIKGSNIELALGHDGNNKADLCNSAG